MKSYACHVKSDEQMTFAVTNFTSPFLSLVFIQSPPHPPSALPSLIFYKVMSLCLSVGVYAKRDVSGDIRTASSNVV